MCTLNSLYHEVAVDEVRADPGWVEDSLSIVKEYYTNYVVANVTLFIDLCARERGERERESHLDTSTNGIFSNNRYHKQNDTSATHHANMELPRTCMYMYTQQK